MKQLTLIEKVLGGPSTLFVYENVWSVISDIFAVALSTQTLVTLLSNAGAIFIVLAYLVGVAAIVLRILDLYRLRSFVKNLIYAAAIATVGCTLIPSLGLQPISVIDWIAIGLMTIFTSWVEWNLRRLS